MFIECKRCAGFCSSHHDPEINKNVSFLPEAKMFNIDKSFIKYTFKIKLAKLSAMGRE